MSAQVEKNVDRRKRVFVGALPPDFLRITDPEPASQQEDADAQAAMALQQQLVGVPHTNNAVGRLILSVIQAQLVKNYGMTRMDPYVRIRVGHSVYETQTDGNGGKNPKWNKEIQSLLPKGVNCLFVEIFDECSFTPDELIAWGQVPIPPAVLKGETVQNDFLLSGKQGDSLEGSITLVMSYAPVNSGAYSYYPAVAQPVAPVLTFPTAYGIGGYHTAVPYAPHGIQTAVPVAPPLPQPNPEDIRQIEEMFPNMDKEVIRSVYECNRYRKDITVNSLLQMAE